MSPFPDQLNALNETVAAAPLAIAQDPELIGDFINEATEHLATIEAEALALERDPASADSLHAAFRGIHTIKGLAGFLELSDIREVTHEVETLLDRARNGELAVTPEMIDVVLETADLCRTVGARAGGSRESTRGTECACSSRRRTDLPRRPGIRG